MKPTSNKMASAVVSLTSRFLFQVFRRFIVFAILFLPVTCYSQINTTPVTKNEIPASIILKGNYLDAYKWNDIDGEHLLIRTKSEETPSADHPKEEGFFDASLYAFHYLLNKDSSQLVWKLQDFQKECEFDITAEFIKNSFIITDLDKNNRAEIWLMYRIACRSDVSPANLKLIMYEGIKKYALRGTTKIPMIEPPYDGGEMVFDDAFNKGSKLFKDYATKLWKKFVVETFE